LLSKVTRAELKSHNHETPSRSAAAHAKQKRQSSIMSTARTPVSSCYRLTSVDWRPWKQC